MEYDPEDDCYDSTDDEDTKRARQQKHYELLEKLQSLASEAPRSIQQRLPNELLSQLARSLLDGTVFMIVRELREMQKVTEKNLFQDRLALQRLHAEEKMKMASRHKQAVADCSATPHRVPQLQSSHKVEAQMLESKQEEAINNQDFKICDEIDELVKQQQSLLDKAAVPGFHLTDNAVEIRVQMRLLEFVCKLLESAD